MRCVLMKKCEDRYPYLQADIEGVCRQISNTLFLFYPLEDEHLPQGCSRQDFYGYVIEAECLQIIDNNP